MVSLVASFRPGATHARISKIMAVTDWGGCKFGSTANTMKQRGCRLGPDSGSCLKLLPNAEDPQQDVHQVMEYVAGTSLAACAPGFACRGRGITHSMACDRFQSVWWSARPSCDTQMEDLQNKTCKLMCKPVAMWQEGHKDTTLPWLNCPDVFKSQAKGCP